MEAQDKKQTTGLLDQASQAQKGLRRLIDLFLKGLGDSEPAIRMSSLIFAACVALSLLSIVFLGLHISFYVLGRKLDPFTPLTLPPFRVYFSVVAGSMIMGLLIAGYGLIRLVPRASALALDSEFEAVNRLRHKTAEDATQDDK